MRLLILLAAAVVFLLIAAPRHAAGTGPQPRPQVTITLTPAQACQRAIGDLARQARAHPDAPASLTAPAVCDGTDPGTVIGYIMNAMQGT